MKDRRGNEYLRLFVAAYPPEIVASELRAAIPPALLPSLRLTPREQIHLTVLFLGNVEARNLEDIIESVSRSCAGQPAFALTFEKLTGLPHRGPKRLIAATSQATASLLEIRTRLIRRLARQSRERPNDRYLPHMTLARFRQPQRVELEEPLSLESISMKEVCLMRSDLGPGGATHSLVHTCRLGTSQG